MKTNPKRLPPIIIIIFFVILFFQCLIVCYNISNEYSKKPSVNVEFPWWSINN